jgi:hypothetical protein
MSGAGNASVSVKLLSLIQNRSEAQLVALQKLVVFIATPPTFGVRFTKSFRTLVHAPRLIAGNEFVEIFVIGSRGEVTINPRELMGRRASIRAFTLWAITPEEEADIHAGLFAGLENGALRPIVGKELPLAEAARTQGDS